MEGGRPSVGSSVRRWLGGLFHSTPLAKPPPRRAAHGRLRRYLHALTIGLRRSQSIGHSSNIKGRPSRSPDGVEGEVCRRGVERTPGDTCSPPATAGRPATQLAVLSGPLGHNTLNTRHLLCFSSRPIYPSAFLAKIYLTVFAIISPQFLESSPIFLRCLP